MLHRHHGFIKTVSLNLVLHVELWQTTPSEEIGYVFGESPWKNPEKNSIDIDFVPIDRD